MYGATGVIDLLLKERVLSVNKKWTYLIDWQYVLFMNLPGGFLGPLESGERIKT